MATLEATDDLIDLAVLLLIKQINDNQKAADDFIESFKVRETPKYTEESTSDHSITSIETDLPTEQAEVMQFMKGMLFNPDFNMLDLPAKILSDVSSSLFSDARRTLAEPITFDWIQVPILQYCIPTDSKFSLLLGLPLMAYSCLFVGFKNYKYGVQMKLYFNQTIEEMQIFLEHHFKKKFDKNSKPNNKANLSLEMEFPHGSEENVMIHSLQLSSISQFTCCVECSIFHFNYSNELNKYSLTET